MAATSACTAGSGTSATGSSGYSAAMRVAYVRSVVLGGRSRSATPRSCASVRATRSGRLLHPRADTRKVGRSRVMAALSSRSITGMLWLDRSVTVRQSHGSTTATPTPFLPETTAMTLGSLRAGFKLCCIWAMRMRWRRRLQLEVQIELCLHRR